MSSPAGWGGAGSISDVNVLGSPHPDAHADERRFRSAMIALARYLDAHQIGSENARSRARFIAEVFDEWNRRGL